MAGGEGGMGSLGSAGVGGTVPAIGGNNQLNNALTATGGGGQSPISAYGKPQDDQNKQVCKEGFLKASQSALDNDVLKELVKPALSPFQLMAGTIIPGVLECGLNSDLPGQTCTRVTENVFDSGTGRYLLIRKERSCSARTTAKWSTGMNERSSCGPASYSRTEARSTCKECRARTMPVMQTSMRR